MSHFRRQKRAATKPVSETFPMLNKLPPELCFLILDNLADEDIQRLLYSCRVYLSAFIEYFAARNTVKGPIYAIRYKQKFLLHNMGLNENIDINIKDEHGTNALLIAVTESQETMVKELLSHTKIDVNVKNQNYLTPTRISTNNKHIGITTALLETGKVDLKSTNGRGETLLHEAVRYGGVDIAKLVSLVSNPLDFHKCDASRWTPFKLILARGYEEVFNIYTRVRSEPPVLHVAENEALFYATENHLELFALKILQLKGFRVRHYENGYTALMQASRRGLGLVVEELLLRPEVNHHAVDYSNQNAIQYASEARHLATVCCLFNHGISPRGDESILWLAAEAGKYEAFQLLRSHNTYERKSNNDRCLCFAISGQDKRIITEALEMSSDINYHRVLTTALGAGVLDSMSQAIQHVFGPDGQTLFGNLLIEATNNQNTYFVKTLLFEYKVEPNYADNRGRTALSYAAEMGNISITSILLRGDNIDTNLRDTEGRAPLDYAVSAASPYQNNECLRRLALHPLTDLSSSPGGVEEFMAVLRKKRQYRSLRDLRNSGVKDNAYRRRNDKSTKETIPMTSGRIRRSSRVQNRKTASQ